MLFTSKVITIDWGDDFELGHTQQWWVLTVVAEGWAVGLNGPGSRLAGMEGTKRKQSCVWVGMAVLGR